MNCLTQALADICLERPLDEKWLVAPTLRIGHQWVEVVARSGRPVVNVNVTTLRRMALDLAGGEIAGRGVSLASDLECEALVDAACRDLAREDGYLLSGDSDPGLARAVAAAVQALRAGGLSGLDLDPKRFEVAEKGREIVAVLDAYVVGLAGHGLVDYADACGIAAKRVAADPTALPANLAVLLPGDIDVSPIEQALLDAIPKRACIELPVDAPGAAPAEGGDLTDATLLRWTESPLEAPPPSFDGTAHIFRAEGEVNEVREVLRRCLAEGIPLDHVEILHADQGTYVPRTYETFARMGYTDSGGLGGMPVTFIDGLPARYTRPGRALSAWAAWARDGHPQSTLVRMLRAGLLRIQGPDDARVGTRELARLLASVSIGSGAERYVPKLDEAISAAERASLHPFRDHTDESEDVVARRREREERRAQGLRAVRDLAQQLVELTPDLRAPEADVLLAGKKFLEIHARSAGELDSFARDGLTKDISEVLAVVEDGPGGIAPGSWEWLSALPRETRVGGSGPRQGCIHVAHVLSGGHSGRAHTFIVGLDDARFPGAGLQDPVLLDGERRRLAGPKLPTAAGRLAERMAGFSRALARLRGHVTLSYSCRSLVDDREGFASPVLVSAYRILSGEREGDQAGLEKWTGRPVSFAPDREDLSLDEAEWWLWRGCAGERIQDAAALVGECHANLARGRDASALREGPDFTIYDGRVPEAAADEKINPLLAGGPVMSASRLEMAGRCPRAYFFKYALRIEPPDDLDVDPDAWLDGLSRGSLLHEVFREFMAELVAAKEKPVCAQHAARLGGILDEHIALYRDEMPPPTESVFRRECAGLREAATIFLAEEEVLCRTSSPVFLEAAVGLPSDGDGTDLDTKEPVTVDLGGGRTIRVRGRLDRIDRVEPPAGSEGKGEHFAVWDYKTGSTFKYREKDPFWQGRNVQHAIYLRIAEVALREKVSPEARVALFGYFFAGPKGQGERKTYTPRELTRGREVITRLCDTVAGGAFAATDRQGDCDFCDYAPVCGQTKDDAAVSRSKLDHEANADLEPFRRLRSDDGGGADG